MFVISSFFDKLAVGIISKCYAADEKMAQLLLVREIPMFGDTTILSLAVATNSMNFIAHAACQTLLNNIWKGRIHLDVSMWKILLCVLFPPFVLSPTIKFRENDFLGNTVIKANDCIQSIRSRKLRQDLAQREYYEENKVGNDNEVAREVLEKDLEPEEEDDDEEEKEEKFLHGCSCWDICTKYKSFYKSPVVVFAHNYIFYTFFLLLFSYIVLTSFKKEKSIPELVLCGWVGTLCMEEIRQILMEENATLRLKLAFYLKDWWNVLDASTLVLFYVGFCLKWLKSSLCPSCFEASHVVLSVNLTLFYFRILHIFSIHKNLGPKLVMIGKMMMDLFSFLIILVVFILAYGSATHAILYPNSELDWSLIKNIFRKAYFQIYGELFLEEIEGENCKGTPDDRCPTNVGKWFVPILLAIYILFTNVLMLNLLIAIFR